MRKVIAALMFLILAQTASFAQTRNEPRGWGYLFGGAGSSSGSPTAQFQVGGGGEALAHKGLGLGAEVGYIAPFRAAGDGFGIISADVSYHFQKRSSKFAPFVTGGYSLAFRSGTSSGGDFGGGAQYWIKEHVALRFEFRDHVFSSDSPHFYQFRVGLAFR